eukprot:GILK01000076.1.p1 GENE.GILK01000076.1~~GILK01000076.1.p1  ORF type:complete len:320 (+),score=52.12 GILK01000076.1:34-960(+)
MSKFVAVFIVALLAGANADLLTPVVNPEMIDHINSNSFGWRAGASQKWAGKTLADAKKLLGTRIAPMKNVRVANYAKLANFVDVPASFDAREGAWKAYIHPVRDQQQCGSCWAFGATEAFSDRLAIASNGKIDVVLSPEHLVSCDTQNYGCQGGYLDKAWDFIETTGVVSDACFPYTAGSGVAPACASTCADGSSWTTYKAKAGSVRQFTDVASIQLALMTNGPLEVAFSVYQDFFNYQSGVYSHVSGGLAGGHAVKLVGWGSDAGTDYWTIANSWGTGWGEQGFFRIKRGNNECGVESNVIAALPDL